MQRLVDHNIVNSVDALSIVIHNTQCSLIVLLTSSIFVKTFVVLRLACCTSRCACCSVVPATTAVVHAYR